MIFKTLRVQSSRHVLAVLAICALSPTSAMAQAAPSFIPNGWTVGSTELASVRGLKGLQLPCVISSEYDNGYIVRFSGGGNQMLALAIDFRQNVFEKGRKYNSMLTVGGGYVKQLNASAFTPSTLIFSLRDVPDIYSVLKTAKDMSLDVEGNEFNFSLQQMANNFGSLESCYATGQADPIQPIHANAPVQGAIDIPPVQAQNLPQTFDDIMSAPADGGGPMKITQVTPRGPEENDSVLPRANSVSRAANIARSPAAKTWNASAGEDMRSVLSRWSQTAGYDLQWQASDNGKVAQDTAFSGSFEEAVSQLLAENRAATGIAGRFETGAASSNNVASSSAKWSAPAGASVQSVLDDWAGRAGVKIVWKSYSGILLKNPVNQSDSFESAVSAVLDQFAGDSKRPVGQLNIDPKTKKRTLIMDLDKTS